MAHHNIFLIFVKYKSSCNLKENKEANEKQNLRRFRKVRSNSFVKKLLPPVVFLYKLKLKKLALLKTARAQNNSAHDYSTVAHKRKPQETNNPRMLIILGYFNFIYFCFSQLLWTPYGVIIANFTDQQILKLSLFRNDFEVGTT